jgi:5-methylcytosine-specific restriction endonuclease McrA
LAAESERRRREWERVYSAYLNSDRWREKREKVMRRANFVCEGCGNAKATDAHHLTYRRVGDEMLFDLVALCRAGHERCHPHVQRVFPAELESEIG